MDAVLEFPTVDSLVERLSWVLMHSAWQFLCIALLAATLTELMRRASAEARSAVLCLLLLVLIACPIATWILHPTSSTDDLIAAEAARDQDEPRAINPSARVSTAGTIQPADFKEVAATATPPAASSFSDDTRTTWMTRANSIMREWYHWLVPCWIIGVTFCSLRPLLGWFWLRRLKRVGVTAVGSDVVAAVSRASERLGLRRSVGVLESKLAKVPLLIGYLRPTILLPLGLLTSLPPAQLEAILAHELAHIRRRDYLVNLIQVLIETLFFYHPAVWWLSYRIRVEREHCCDDLVITSMNNRAEYGRALVAIEYLRHRNPSLALGVAGGSLLDRIRRITWTSH